jgi:hypothetical protein
VRVLLELAKHHVILADILLNKINEEFSWVAVLHTIVAIPDVIFGVNRHFKGLLFKLKKTKQI